MSDRPEPPAWIAEQPGLTVLALASVVLALQVVLPYLQYVLFGLVLAYVLTPVQRRLVGYVRPTVAAFVLVVVAVVVIVLPLAYVLVVALQQTSELVSAVQNGAIDIGWIEREFGIDGDSVDLADLYGSYQDVITSSVQGLATSAINIAGGLPGVAIGVTITLFVCFALLRDGDRLTEWSYRVLPVDDDLQRELFDELDLLMQASVVSNVVVAAIQAMMLGVALVILDFPAVVLLTVLTFVLTLLPLVGAFGVWLPASIYLAAVDRPVAAVALVGYGLLVTFSDTYLRPALIGRTSAFNSATIVVGIFGGLVAFGAVGLFVGPVVLGGVKVVLDLFGRVRVGETVADATSAADADADS